MYRYFKKIGRGGHISAWKSKGLSDESTKPHAIFNNGLAPSLSYIVTKTRVKFEGQCLKQDKVTFTHKAVVNVYIFYEINLWNCGHDNYPTLENYLFGAVKLTKNANIGK